MTSRLHFVASLAIAATAIGCGDRHSGNHSAPAPVPANTAKPACVISADCPAGEHCDLGECIQDCNTVDPCTGDLVCSPRARCLAPEAADRDPPPETTFAGTVAVSPLESSLTALDKTLKLSLPVELQPPGNQR
jgi:hypothetical protein